MSSLPSLRRGDVEERRLISQIVAGNQAYVYTAICNIEQLICLKSKTFFSSRLANTELFPVLILDWVGRHSSVNSALNIPF